MRDKSLPLVVDNPSFPILTWVEIPNLGSHLLVRARRLPGTRTECYNTTTMPIDTFVEAPRYACTVYRESGWTPVGTT